MNNLSKYILEKLNLNDIPVDTGVDDEPEEYEGVPKYKSYSYFGDCKNTVDKDHMWDATQMSGWLKQCKILDIDNVLDKIQNGDRNIPKQFTKALDKLGDKVHDLSEVCCGIDDYQRIMFIYISSLDTHYFFDCDR